MLERLKHGEDVDLAALAEELPPFFRAVASKGGLLRYGTHLLGGEVTPKVQTGFTVITQENVDTAEGQEAAYKSSC